MVTFTHYRAGRDNIKTATTADKKTTLLPLVCLGHVFHSDSWAAAWLLLVEAQHWPEDQEFFLPSFSEYLGTWSSRRMTSGEGTFWLRERPARLHSYLGWPKQEALRCLSDR